MRDNAPARPSRCKKEQGVGKQRTRGAVADYPAVLAQWHPTKNNGVQPSEVAAGSRFKVWWKCPRGVDHEWTAPPYIRIGGGSGCPYCAGRRASVTNSLATIRPEVAIQWHPTKNLHITPYDVPAGSHQRHWWLCPNSLDHEWESPVVWRTRSKNPLGCPFCAGRRPSVTNSIASRFPDIARQWHPSRNGSMTPDQVSATSGKKYWWKCPNGPDHEWRATPDKRTGKSKRGCPFCAGRRLSVSNSLALRYPAIAAQWHRERNGDLLPADVVVGSTKLVWWKCLKGPDHEWRASIVNRTANGSGCPCCAGLKVSVTNSLSKLFPKIAAEFHPTRNGAWTPDQIVASSNKVFWWKCPRGPDHEWRTRVVHRTAAQSNCPFCTIAPRSRIEIIIAFELAALLPIDVDDHKIRVRKRILDVDIILRQDKIVIEFDGSYWHREREHADQQKTLLLTGAGWHVVRLRQRPLKRLTANDILVPHVIKPQDIKEVVDETLHRIQEMRCARIPGLGIYLRRRKLKKSAVAERYIQRLMEGHKIGRRRTAGKALRELARGRENDEGADRR